MVYRKESMPDIKELAKSLREKPEFADFQDYVLGKVAELDTVDGLEEMSNEMAGETARARKLAIDTLRDILKPFIEFSEKQGYTKEQIEEAAARRGL